MTGGAVGAARLVGLHRGVVRGGDAGGRRGRRPGERGNQVIVRGDVLEHLADRPDARRRAPGERLGRHRAGETDELLLDVGHVAHQVRHHGTGSLGGGRRGRDCGEQGGEGDNGQQAHERLRERGCRSS
jgi:hypothetical protein